MPEGMSATTANASLSAWSGTYRWVKLHIGAPGAAGTANPAAETTRQQVTWSAPSGGSMANTDSPEWTGVAGSEDYTHWSAWSAATAGTFGFSGVLTADPVVAGNDARIEIGDLVVSFPLAS